MPLIIEDVIRSKEIAEEYEKKGKILEALAFYREYFLGLLPSEFKERIKKKIKELEMRPA